MRLITCDYGITISIAIHNTETLQCSRTNWKKVSLRDNMGLCL